MKFGSSEQAMLLPEVALVSHGGAHMSQSRPSLPCGQIIRVLELTKSTYHTSFSRLIKEVATASAEATDNVKYLETLRPDLERLSSLPPSEFAELVTLFNPMMHRCMLVWKHSLFYNTPARLAVLFREVCNALIDKESSCPP